MGAISAATRASSAVAGYALEGGMCIRLHRLRCDEHSMQVPSWFPSSSFWLLWTSVMFTTQKSAIQPATRQNLAFDGLTAVSSEAGSPP